MSKIEEGMTLPDFVLPDEDGNRHRLSTLQGDDVMVLMLGRGEHCPRERQHQKEMVKFHEWCDLAFTRLATVLPNDFHDVYKMRIATGATGPTSPTTSSRSRRPSRSTSTPTPTTTRRSPTP